MPALEPKFKKAVTTHVCPGWTIPAIIDGTKSYGYEGVELIVGEEHAHGIDLDQDDATYRDMRSQFDDNGLALACLGTPCEFASPDPDERQDMLELAKRYLQLADRLGCPYIRIQGGIFPIDMEPAGVIDYIADTLLELTEFAEENFSTTVLLQTNQGLSHSRYAREVVKQVYSEKLAIAWDVANCARVLESDEDSFDNISEWLKMLYVQNFDYSEDRADLLVAEPDAGFVDFSSAIEYMRNELYRGFVTVCVQEEDPDPNRIMKSYSEYLDKIIASE